MNLSDEQEARIEALKAENERLRLSVEDWASNAKRLAEKEIELERREQEIIDREIFIKSFLRLSTMVFEDLGKKK